MKKTWFVLDTSTALFYGWLRHVINEAVADQSLSTEPGKHWLLMPVEERHFRGNVAATFGVEATVVTVRDNSEKLMGLDPTRLINIAVTPLSAERIRVDVECEDELVKLWRVLLAMVYADYSEARSAIDESGGAGLAEDDPDDRDAQILTWWREGWTAPEIGRELSLAAGRVRNILTGLRKKLGVEAVPYHTNS